MSGFESGGWSSIFSATRTRLQKVYRQATICADQVCENSGISSTSCAPSLPHFDPLNTDITNHESLHHTPHLHTQPSSRIVRSLSLGCRASPVSSSSSKFWVLAGSSTHFGVLYQRTTTPKSLSPASRQQPTQTTCVSHDSYKKNSGICSRSPTRFLPHFHSPNTALTNVTNHHNDNHHTPLHPQYIARIHSPSVAHTLFCTFVLARFFLVASMQNFRYVRPLPFSSSIPAYHTALPDTYV